MFPRRSIHRNVFRGLLVAALACDLSAQAPEEPEDIRGPKPLIEIPQPEKPDYALWGGLGGVALALLVAGMIWKNRSRKQLLKNPRELALMSLAELEATRDRLPAEAFAGSAAQTIRQYIADRFGLAAPRRTTEEFLRELAADDSSTISREGDHLRSFLKSCDLAKFAGSDLNAVQRVNLLDAAREFVRATAAPASNTKPGATP